MSTTGTLSASRRDAVPHIRPAGRYLGAAEGGVRACLDHVSDESQRPPTPPEIAKYRKSTREVPGRPVQHPGLVGVAVPDMTFGRRYESNGSAAERVNPPLPTVAEERLTRVSERLYLSTKKEPLGQAMTRGHALPEETRDASFAFGKTVPPSEDAKNVLYPIEHPADDAADVRAQYVRTHGSFGPGEQRQRNYDWQGVGIDPNAQRFGAVEKNVVRNGVKLSLQHETPHDTAVIVTKQQGDAHALKDELGKPRNMGFGNRAVDPDTVFGAPSTKYRDWGVAECLRGNAATDYAAEDESLGRSVRPGFRNVAPEDRVFGVPTVRTDVPAPRNRSVADVQNYGGEPNARGVVFPSRFAHGGVFEEDFVTPRTQEELWDILSSSGAVSSRVEFETIFERASRATPGVCSIQAYRQCKSEMVRF